MFTYATHHAVIINGELEGCETNRMINLLSPSTIVLGRTVMRSVTLTNPERFKPLTSQKDIDENCILVTDLKTIQNCMIAFGKLVLDKVMEGDFEFVYQSELNHRKLQELQTELK